MYILEQKGFVVGEGSDSQAIERTGDSVKGAMNSSRREPQIDLGAFDALTRA